MSEHTDRYVYLHLENYGLTIHVKLDDEGVVVDAWGVDDGNDGEGVVDSTYKLYSEMGLRISYEPLTV